MVWIPVHVRCSRTRRTSVQGQEGMDVLAKRAESPFLSLLVLLRLSTDWIMTTHIGENVFLYSVYQLNVNLNVNHRPRPPRKNV